MTTLLESQWVTVPELTAQQALALEVLGQQLAVGQPTDGDSAANLVQCRKSTAGSWQVKVSECIGVIGCEGQTWVVAPKIAMSHLLYLMSAGGTLPRTSRVPVNLSHGDDFWRLLFEWLLDQVELLVRRDLLKGYVREHGRLPYMRGTVDQLQLARGLLRGSTSMLCTYEEFSPDIPPNRLLKSALLMGLRSGLLNEGLAKRCRRLLARFEGVGEAVASDLYVEVTRETRSYGEAVQLAKNLLKCLHRALSEGTERAWCFLWRTPDAVEAGLREVVRTELQHWSGVTKKSRSHGELRFNPDLVFEDVAVGDVKYSIDTGGWRRSDVNQLLAFATAFACEDALLVNFTTAPLSPKSATVAPVRLTRIAWVVSDSVADAEASFRTAVRTWFLKCKDSAGAAGHPASL